MRFIQIFTDGAARGNPGRSASGYMIYEDGKLIKEEFLYNGIKTNNFAEYTAIIKALEWVLGNIGSECSVTVNSDSELVVKQANGLYKVKSKSMAELNLRLRKLMGSFSSVKLVNRRREDPGIVKVDAALNMLLDKIEKGESPA
ncbi:MAG: ribonuclease HI family protein [Candidatus Micrarchaeaceae archaeon]